MKVQSLYIINGREEPGPLVRMEEDRGLLLGDRHLAIFCNQCGNIWLRHIKLAPGHLSYSGHAWSLYHAACPSCLEASGGYYTHLFGQQTPKPLIQEDILRTCEEIEQ